MKWWHGICYPAVVSTHLISRIVYWGCENRSDQSPYFRLCWPVRLTLTSVGTILTSLTEALLQLFRHLTPPFDGRSSEWMLRDAEHYIITPKRHTAPWSDSTVPMSGLACKQNIAGHLYFFMIGREYEIGADRGSFQGMTWPIGKSKLSHYTR